MGREVRGLPQGCPARNAAATARWLQPLWGAGGGGCAPEPRGALSPSPRPAEGGQEKRSHMPPACQRRRRHGVVPTGRPAPIHLPARRRPREVSAERRPRLPFKGVCGDVTAARLSPVSRRAGARHGLSRAEPSRAAATPSPSGRHAFGPALQAAPELRCVRGGRLA